MIKSIKPVKPAKPYKDFPLFPHATRRWAKRIRGRHVYFGPWSDPDAALELYLFQKEDLYAGRTPRSQTGELTVKDLVNKFLNAKKTRLNNGKLAEVTFHNYYNICGRITKAFGKTRLVDDLRADDFGTLRTALAKTLGPNSLRSVIMHVKIIFKFASDQGLIQQPINYGQSFDKPTKKVIRLDRQQKQRNGKRMIQAEELRRILSALDGTLDVEELRGKFGRSQPDPIMRAMILLGVNCGFGATDISNIPQSAIDFNTGWVDFPRIKTAEERRIPLWDETLDAVHDAIYARPKPKDTKDEDLIFLTNTGLRWVMMCGSKKFYWKDAVGRKFSLVLSQLNMKRPGLGFYCLRHGFETVAGESKDQVAVNACMGHVDQSMGGLYRESISDERLKAVTDTVRRWLWPEVEVTEEAVTETSTAT